MITNSEGFSSSPASNKLPQQAMVTGGRGFIARHVVKRLVSAGVKVTVVDLPTRDKISDLLHPDVKYVDGDIRDRRLLERASANADVVFHFAAVVGVDLSTQNPDLVQDVNITGTGNVVAVAKLTGARLVFGSTSEIYGRNPLVPWTESSESVLGPTSHTRWCYAASKILAEHLILQAAAQSGVDARILRFFNVYGPYQRPDFVISRSIHRALQGKPIEIHNGGEQTRCFTFVDDVVEAVISAASLQVPPGSVFNIGSSSEVSMKEALTLLHEMIADPAVELLFVDRSDFSAQYEDVPRRVPYVDRAARMLGWAASTDLRCGLTRTLVWARKSTWWWK